MKHIYRIIFTITLFLNYNNGYSWEVYDKVIATVNETPIVESEVTSKFDRLYGLKKAKQWGEKSRLLDKFIEEAIVEQTAKKESIIVSPEKVDNHIKKIMNRMNFRSIEAFKKEIEKSENISFEEYKEELRKSLITEQIMSIAIGMSPPSVKEAEDWYRKNRDKMGYEVNIQHILFKLQNESYAENKRVNKLAVDLNSKIRDMSFENAARDYSEDAGTKNNAGNMGWVALSNLAKNDMIFADNIYKEFIVNQRKYAVVKSSIGYHIVKFNGSRPSTFEAVKDEIFNILYQKKMVEQFKKWIVQKKTESDIKIYMSEYIKEKANG
ncbi:MAG: peptidylprolyl isomerase [Spirochaetota bacterium]